jgi:4-carboxymuconolactone decarboxylase
MADKTQSDSRKVARDKGLAMRKRVLGDAYVEKSMAGADAFSAPFQEWLNESCWGVAWTDDRLTPKTRSMLNVALLAGINRMHEWELHLKGALNNGVTRDEVQAIIQHVAVYAGAPVGVECMRIARKVFAEIDGAK